MQNKILCINIMVSKKNNYRKIPKTKKNQVVRKIANQEARKVIRKNVETKMYDGVIASIESDWDGAAYSATYNLASATSMVQSTTDFGYIGNKIQPFMYQARIRFTNTGNEDTSFNTVRVIVLQVIGGGVPSPLNVLASVGNERTTLSAYDRNYRDTYRVLYDRLMIINYDSDAAKVLKLTIKKGLGPITFADTLGTIQQGGLYLVIYSDEDSILTSPSINAYHRLYYKDA